MDRAMSHFGGHAIGGRERHGQWLGQPRAPLPAAPVVDSDAGRRVVRFEAVLAPVHHSGPVRRRVDQPDGAISGVWKKGGELQKRAVLTRERQGGGILQFPAAQHQVIRHHSVAMALRVVERRLERFLKLHEVGPIARVQSSGEAGPHGFRRAALRSQGGSIPLHSHTLSRMVCSS